MTPRQVIRHFGGRSRYAAAKTARSLGLKGGRQVVHNWLRRGRVPAIWQLRIREMTQGKLQPTQLACQQLELGQEKGLWT